MFAGQHEFAAAEREYLMSLADLCAVYLRRRSGPAGPPRQALSAARLDELVDALARAESADAVATVIAERGAAGGASFANVAVLDPGTDASARMYHASSLQGGIRGAIRGHPGRRVYPAGHRPADGGRGVAAHAGRGRGQLPRAGRGLHHCRRGSGGRRWP